MSDYNNGILPEPCLRMDTHFGDEYESIEFGDGTGYIKAAPILAKVDALREEIDMVRDENAKLRELCVKALEWLRWAGGITCPPEVPDEFADELRELGIEVDA